MKTPEEPSPSERSKPLRLDEARPIIEEHAAYLSGGWLGTFVHILCDGAKRSLWRHNGVQGAKVPRIEQCRAYAAEYKILGNEHKISARRSAVLLGISRSWTTLAHKLEHLTEIVKEEGK